MEYSSSPGVMVSSRATVTPRSCSLRLDAVGDARAPGRAVIQDRDPLARPMLGQVVGDHHPLPVVPAVHAEHVRAAFLGQLRARRARGDHENPCLLVHLRGRDRGVRAPVAGDEDDAVTDQLAGERHRLIGIAEVVAHDQLDFLAEHAALGVEVLDRHLGAALIPLAGPGVDRRSSGWPSRSGSRPPPPAR